MQVFQIVVKERDERGEDDKGLALAIVWRACAIVGGMYLFYVFEVVLRKLTDRTTPEEVC